MKDRKFDIVLFGATGFTGKLAAEHVARTYGKNVKWAIAGRNLKRLEAVREHLVKINADSKELELLVADSAN